MQNVYLLLGSNLGDKKKYLEDAEMLIGEKIGNIITKSAIYISEPWGFKHKEDFYNQVIIINTNYSALKVLALCLEIENLLGRKRKKGTYEARTIDIDLLLYGNEIIHNKKLTVPHPQMHRRRFTLEPLCEIAPDLIHPIFNMNMVQLLDECTDTGKVERLEHQSIFKPQEKIK